MRKFLNLVFLLVLCQGLFAQYTLNGNATRDACNEYTLTAAVNWQGGSVWNNIKIDLTQSFDFNFDVLLGSNNSPGADGIAFVLQPVSTSVGSSGGGMGYEGITPAVGVIIDTYENGGNNDPAFDHIAVQLNGNISHNTVNNIAGPVTVLNGNDNIEDGKWHSLRIVWNAATKTLSATVDGSLRLSVVKDLVTDVFSGDPFVYWGFTGATGGENNLQKFKTALNPAFNFGANQKRCINEPLTFYDSTVSFTPIVKFYWDFGDGSPLDSVNINPVHTYTAAGDYTVIQRVIGADGCEATNTKVVQIGSKPLANFGYSSPLCNGLNVQFTDSTVVAVGVASQWNWIHNGSVWSNLQNPGRIFTAGTQTIKLVTTSNAGCVSDTAVKTILINPAPDVSFDFSDACINTPVQFTATDNSGNVTGWEWTFGDGGISNAKDTLYAYATGGTYPVQLTATASNGCKSDLPPENINIYSTLAFAGNDTITASGQPLQLQATGGVNYEWSPASGLNNPNIANPIAVLTGTQTYAYTVRAYTPLGCESFDTINIQVYQAPEIYLPNAFTPNGDGLNDLYKGKPVGIRDFKYLEIFNRFGQQVFYTTDFLNGWDGTYKGKQQGNGVYVVIARGIDYRGLVVDRQGTVMLIR